MGKKIHLPMKSEWYLMIESGEKKEEYREITPYWCCRLLKDRFFGDKFPQKFYEEKIAKVNDVPVEFRMDVLSKLLVSCFLKLVNVNVIVFHYGYTKRTMKWWVKDLRIGYGYPDWGAEQGKPYFVFELGGRIE
ncbi:MAG: hypothetical protein UH850_03450 [Paludibacteraceae bacterium]|nr:hypothetical protein [Paludibacteraceae bacterium]